MRVRKFLAPVVGAAVVCGLAVAGYKTRDRWVPLVFPDRSAAKAEGGHGHGEGEKADPHAGHDHAHAAGERVKLSPQAQANLKLDIDALVSEEYWRKMLIPGVVVDLPGLSDRGVTAPVAGVVLKAYARPGDTVRPGEKLFDLRLVSEYIQNTQTELFKAAKELEITRQLKARLEESGVVPPGRLLEVDAQIKRHMAIDVAYRQDLLTRGFTPDQVAAVTAGTFVKEVSVFVPPAAAPPPADSADKPPPADRLLEIQELRVNLGEQIQAGQTLCTMANHQQLFVEGRAFKSEAKALAKVAETKVPVTAEFADEGKGDWPALPPLHVHHLANTVDQASRTFAFYLPLDNQPETFTRDGKPVFVWRFRPGQRVRLHVPVEQLGTKAADGGYVPPFVLPAGAVVREGAEAFVFVQNGDLFERKPVRVLYEDRAEAVVANDGSVPEGLFVVRNNAAAVNRAVKAAAGAEGGGGDHHGHSHDH